MKMKKLLLIGLLLSMGTGCGRSWLPMFNRGASCNGGGCLGAAPALPPAAGCNTCPGSAAGYGNYGGEIINSYDGGVTSFDGGYSSPIIGSGVMGSGPSGGIITNPSMSTLPSP
jgi:hypothetical protein